MRHVASDTWEEKTMDDQKKQSKKLFAHGVVKEVKKEVQFNKEEDSMENFFCLSRTLMDAVKSCERKLSDIKHENHHQRRPKFNQQLHQQTPTHVHTGLREYKPAAPIAPSKPTPQSYSSSLPQPTKQDAGSRVIDNTSPEDTSEVHMTQNPVEQESASLDSATTTAPKEVQFADEFPKQNSIKKEIESMPKDQLTTVLLSRGHSKEISRLMKSGGQEHKELALTYNTLDFAGQKEYHPMHHCFITRRAIYLVVFNLQKMISYITKKEQDADNPLEQIRYWLHSIHAHVFPPNEGDHMRRVCLVGTHRAPKDGDEITEEKMKQIDDELRTLERDERCVSHLHYTSNPVRMFIAVENSMDDERERKLSGALQLQRELKEVSDNLTFLKEDHPIIWLNFEARLVELCNMCNSVVVSVQDVLAMASQQGIEIEDDKCLALDFFHDTGKIIYLSKC